MFRAVILTFVAISANLAAAQSSSCAATSCLVGSRCVESGGVARCVAPPATNCSKAHEEWRSCATCEPTCDNRQPFCVKMCKPASCQCRVGFFRQVDGTCVTENDCDVMGGRRRRSAVITPTITCANVRCAGPCTDTPTGPKCGPRPQILPISVGPTSNTPLALNACAVTECVSGRVCVEEAGVAKCVERSASRQARSTPKISCANVRCAGPCTDTPNGPKCGPRPLILPISAGPSSTDAPQPEVLPQISCANVRCAGPCTDTPNGPKCGPRPLILPISAGPSSTEGPQPEVLPQISCANVDCVGPCTDTPNGPKCGPRPQILPISAGPSGARARRATGSCATVKCVGGCKDTPSGPICEGPRPQILPIWAGPSSN